MLPENESSEEHVLWPRSTSFRIWIRGINWSFGVIYPTGPFCSVCVLGRLVLSRSDILGTRVVESWLLAQEDHLMEGCLCITIVVLRRSIA